jgi:hypothetical protein
VWNVDWKQNETNAVRDTESLKIRAAARNRSSHFQLTKTHGRWQGVTIAPLRGSPMENGETGSKGNAIKTAATNESTGKVRPPRTVLTSQTNLISLQIELKIS